MSEEKDSAICSILSNARQKLASVSDTPQLDAEILMSSAVGVSREDLLINSSIKVPLDLEQKIQDFLKQRILGYSVAQIIQKKHFWKSEFIVTNNTFAPRPDTETIISSVLSEYKNKKKQLKIVEFGTGTGCIIVSLAGEYGNSICYGFEKNFNTYLITKKNVALHGLQNRVKIFYRDFKLAASTIGKVDLIVSNPPYIRKFGIKKLQKEIQYEPKIALDGGFNGILPYMEIFKTVILKKDGKIFVEIGDDQEKELVRIARSFSFELIGKNRDLSGKIRVLIFKKCA